MVCVCCGVGVFLVGILQKKGRKNEPFRIKWSTTSYRNKRLSFLALHIVVQKVHTLNVMLLSLLLLWGPLVAINFVNIYKKKCTNLTLSKIFLIICRFQPVHNVFSTILLVINAFFDEGRGCPIQFKRKPSIPVMFYISCPSSFREED